MSPATPARTAYPESLLRNRGFMLLWAAYFIAAVGDNFNDLGQLKLMAAMEGEQATRLMALMLFGLFLPYIVLGPLAGWCADRFSRKGTMIAADLARAVVVINFATLVPAFQDWGFGPYTVMTTQMMLGVLAAFFSPARQAMLPTLVRSDQLVRANGMIGALAPIGAMIGFTVGGHAVEHFGAVWNFRVNSLTYVLSAALILLILAPRVQRQPTRPGRRHVLTPLLEGFTYVRQHRRVAQMIGLGALFWGAAGVVYSCVPAIVKEIVSTRYSDVGNYRALPAVGMVVGAVLMTIVGPSLSIQPAIVTGLSLATVGLLALAAVFAAQLGGGLAALCLVLLGLGGAVLLVTINATLQRLVPDSRRGRVFGVSDMTTMAAMVLATGALGLTPIAGLDRYVAWILVLTAAAMFIALLVSSNVYGRSSPYSTTITSLWSVLVFYVRFWARVRRVGPCTVPREGPVILAANHTSGIDALLILSTCPHRLVGFLVDQRYYHAPIAGWFMRLVNCVPVNREKPGKSFLAQSLRHLKAGQCLGIFPQGTYVSPDEEDPEAKSGVGLLALRTDAPVIPVHLSGTRYDYNPFLALFRRHKARVRYGQPVDLSAFRGRERDKAAPQEATELIMREIRALADEMPDNDR